MDKVLMSISPTYFKQIAEGIKRYEYRKKKCKKHIDRIVFYVGKPVCRICGEVVVGEPLEGNPEKIWNMTKDGAGVTQDEILAYCGGNNWLYAYPIREFNCYNPPCTLEMFGKKYPPQSFYYL